MSQQELRGIDLQRISNSIYRCLANIRITQVIGSFIRSLMNMLDEFVHMVWKSSKLLCCDTMAKIAVETIDYGCEDRRIVGELRGDRCAIRLVLTPSFRKPLFMNPEKRTVQPGGAFEDTTLKWGLKLSNTKTGCRVSAFLKFSVKYICQLWLSDIELNQTSAFSDSYSRINSYLFTAGK
jgi:hypothetical protein